MTPVSMTRLLTLICAGALIFVGCSNNTTGPEETMISMDLNATRLLETPTPQDEEFVDELKPGTFTICKVVEGSAQFTFFTEVEGPGVPTAELYVPEVTLGNGECADVYIAARGVGPDQVTITEDLPAGYQVDRVAIWNLEDEVVTFHELPAGTTQVQGAIDAKKSGCVVIFYNSRIPDEGECARSPGYWKTHPEAWPVESITIGGTTYTKDEALVILWTAERGDKSKTLFRSLVAAMLNEAKGADVSCVATEMSEADQWLTDYPVCSNVRGNSDAWGVGEPLYDTLNDYNNGRLCAPKCEDGEEEEDPEPSAALITE